MNILVLHGTGLKGQLFIFQGTWKNCINLETDKYFFMRLNQGLRLVLSVTYIHVK